MSTPGASQSLKRLTQELSRIQSAPLPRFLSSLHPVSDDDLTIWTATVLGPEETPYEQGRWDLLISIPPSYPLKPPSMKFSTKILHANIHPDSGEICLDLLKDKWSPANTIVSCLEAVHWLLRYPEPESPLNVDLGVLYRISDHAAIESLVRWGIGEWCLPGAAV